MNFSLLQLFLSLFFLCSAFSLSPSPVEKAKLSCFPMRKSFYGNRNGNWIKMRRGKKEEDIKTSHGEFSVSRIAHKSVISQLRPPRRRMSQAKILSLKWGSIVEDVIVGISRAMPGHFQFFSPFFCRVNLSLKLFDGKAGTWLRAILPVSEILRSLRPIKLTRHERDPQPSPLNYLFRTNTRALRLLASTPLSLSPPS